MEIVDSVIRSNLNALWQLVADFKEVVLLGLVLIIHSFISDHQHQQRMALSQQPLINDFYFVDYHQVDNSSDRKYRYLPIKITDVNEQSISYLPGSSGHSEPVSINDHIKFDAPMHYNYFKHGAFTVSRGEFNDWLETGIIYDFARPTKFYIEGWIVLSPKEASRGKKLNARLQRFRNRA